MMQLVQKKKSTFSTKMIQELTLEEARGDYGLVKLMLDGQTNELIKIANLNLQEALHHQWNFVKKNQLNDFLKNNFENNFMELKAKLNMCALDLVLVGYDSKPHIKEITVCLSKESIEESLKQNGLFDKTNYDTLKNKTTKQSKFWTNLGSDEKIIQWQAPNQRPLRTVEAIVPVQQGATHKQHQSLDAEKLKKCYASFRSSGFKSELLIRRTVDINLQACSLRDIEIQTILNLPNKMWTQWEPQLKDEATLTEQESEKMKESVAKKSLQVIEAVHYNAMLNTYENDYAKLTHTLESQLTVSSYVVDHIVNSYKENCGIISCHSWHPNSKDILAVAYSSSNTCSVSDHKEDKSDEFGAHSYITYKVTIWDCSNKIPKQTYLESPCEVSSLAFCPYNPRMIVGGCVNGQLVMWDMEEHLNPGNTNTESHSCQDHHHLHLLKILNPTKKEKYGASVQPTVVTPLCHTGQITGLHWLSRKTEVTQFGVMKAQDVPSIQVLSSSEDGFLFIWDFLVFPPSTSNSNNQNTSSEANDAKQKTSQFAPLHRVIQPVFKVSINGKNTKTMITSSCITSSSHENLIQDTDEIIFVARKSSVAIYDEPPTASLRDNLTLFVGTMNGAVALIDFSKLEIHDDKSTPEFKLAPRAIVHDGPVLCIVQSPFDQSIVLSVGGHTFAVWSHNIKHEPVHLRHGDHYLSSGSWSLFRKSMFYIYREDGILQVWDLLNEKSTLDSEHSLCPGILKALPYLLPSQKSEYLPLADARGTICFFKIPVTHTVVHKNEEIAMEGCLSREVSRLSVEADIEVPESKPLSGGVEEERRRRRRHEERFLQAERDSLARRERSEVEQLQALLQSTDTATRKDAQRKLDLLNELPQALLKLKNIHKETLLKAHQLIVDLEDQDLREKLILKRRMNETNYELKEQKDRDYKKKMPSSLKEDSKMKKTVLSPERYFQDFENLKEKFVSLHNDV